MHEFIAKHQDKIAGTLSGFDRLVFRGHLRSIGQVQGMMSYLWANQVLLKNFGHHVEEITERLKAASLASWARQQEWYSHMLSLMPSIIRISPGARRAR